MSKTSHTPGPWVNHQSHIYAPDGALIAVVRNPGSKATDYPLVANRDLMTAAPDMYAALEIVASELEAMLDAGDVIRGINRAGIAAMRTQVDAARAALAKARGQA